MFSKIYLHEGPTKHDPLMPASSRKLRIALDDPCYTAPSPSMKYYTRSYKTTVDHRATAKPGDSLSDPSTCKLTMQRHFRTHANSQCGCSEDYFVEIASKRCSINRMSNTWPEWRGTLPACSSVAEKSGAALFFHGCSFPGCAALRESIAR